MIVSDQFLAIITSKLQITLSQSCNEHHNTAFMCVMYAMWYLNQPQPNRHMPDSALAMSHTAPLVSAAM